MPVIVAALARALRLILVAGALLLRSEMPAQDAPVAGAAGTAGSAGAPLPAMDWLRVSKPWARATTSDALSGAVYLTLENPGATTRSLLRASCSRCDHCELHQHLRDSQGVMHMLPLPSVSVGAHATLVLQPGGMHVMLIGLTRGLTQGETITLTLQGDSGEVSCQVPVLGAAAMGPDP
jgi:copper(I)-binding protein